MDSLITGTCPAGDLPKWLPFQQSRPPNTYTHTPAGIPITTTLEYQLVSHSRRAKQDTTVPDCIDKIIETMKDDQNWFPIRSQGHSPLQCVQII